MERCTLEFTVTGLRTMNGQIEVKLMHEQDSIVMLVPPTAIVSLGARYLMSLHAVPAKDQER